MRRLLLALAALASLPGMPAAAQTYVYEEVVEEWVETSAQRFVSPELAEAEQRALARYGPFRVLDGTRAALVGVTDSYSPADFAAMLADYPAIATLTFIECPGTYDDRANLRLGRMIRERGLAVEVPEGGSVRSGAVELVLAGTSVTIADGAEFAVHAWLDDRGLSAGDYAPDSPEHGKYLAYYRQMGMAPEAAARFYAMTNAVPFESAMWLTGAEMRDWMGLAGRTLAAEQEPQPRHQSRPEPRMAYLDLDTALN